MKTQQPRDYEYKPMNAGQALVVIVCCLIAIGWIVGALIAGVSQ